MLNFEDDSICKTYLRDLQLICYFFAEIHMKNNASITHVAEDSERLHILLQMLKACSTCYFSFFPVSFVSKWDKNLNFSTNTISFDQDRKTLHFL